MPKYILVGLVTIKLVSIYEKLKVVVAVNQMSTSVLMT